MGYAIAVDSLLRTVSQSASRDAPGALRGARFVWDSASASLPLRALAALPLGAFDPDEPDEPDTRPPGFFADGVPGFAADFWLAGRTVRDAVFAPVVFADGFTDALVDAWPLRVAGALAAGRAGVLSG